MHSDLRKPGCQNARSERAKSKCVFCFSMRFVFSGPVRPVVWSDRSRRGGRRAAFFLGWLACVFLGGVVGVFCWSVGRRGWGLRRVAVRCLQRNTRFFCQILGCRDCFQRSDNLPCARSAALSPRRRLRRARGQARLRSCSGCRTTVAKRDNAKTAYRAKRERIRNMRTNNDGPMTSRPGGAARERGGGGVLKYIRNVWKYVLSFFYSAKQHLYEECPKYRAAVLRRFYGFIANIIRLQFKKWSSF